jgi:hypothetical protein
MKERSCVPYRCFERLFSLLQQLGVSGDFALDQQLQWVHRFLQKLESLFVHQRGLEGPDEYQVHYKEESSNGGQTEVLAGGAAGQDEGPSLQESSSTPTRGVKETAENCPRDPLEQFYLFGVRIPSPP